LTAWHSKGSRQLFLSKLTDLGGGATFFDILVQVTADENR